MRNPISLHKIAMTVVFVSLLAIPAKADLFDLSFVSSNFNIAAQLTANPDGANYDITAITGTVTSNAVPSNIDPLLPASNNPPTPPNTGTSLDGKFFFNDVIFTAGGFHFDVNGLLFTANGFEYNLFTRDNVNMVLNTTDPNSNGNFATDVAAISA